MKKKMLACALILAAGVMAPVNMADAMSRQEIAAIQVNRSSQFRYWQKDSAAYQALISYVEDVTNKKSPNFIPVKDRVAVFDCDGTLMCETAPYYFDTMLSLYRVLDDRSFSPSPQARATAREVRSLLLKHEKLPADLKKRLTKEVKNNAFAGMTPRDFSAYVKNYINTNDEAGLTNLKVGEAFYLPMIEVVSYLQAKDFSVYIVSGCDREMLRVLADGIMTIPPERIIGTNYSYVTENHPNSKLDGYNVVPGEKLLRGNERVFKNTEASKIEAIQREIGRQPVLAFGNSEGDYSMFQYTIHDNPYRSAAFVLLCDDLERDFGNSKKAAATKAAAQENGWISVSMRDDFKTIYGENVIRVNE